MLNDDRARAGILENERDYACGSYDEVVHRAGKAQRSGFEENIHDICDLRQNYMKDFARKRTRCSLYTGTHSSQTSVRVYSHCECLQKEPLRIFCEVKAVCRP